MISAAAEQGDPIALEAFRYTGEMLGRALADVVTVTSPQAISSSADFRRPAS